MIAIFADASGDWSATRPGPYHVEHHGIAWMICDANGYNCCHTPEGVTLMPTEQDAATVLARLDETPIGRGT